MRLAIQTRSLKETTAREFAMRFVFGGVVTVVASLIAKKWGPVIGGIFLAFPGIFPASVSLVEKHKILRETEEGKDGVKSARGEASVEATGASAGAIGLVAFAGVIWKGLPVYGAGTTLVMAFAAWAIVGAVAWLIRERL